MNNTMLHSGLLYHTVWYSITVLYSIMYDIDHDQWPGVTYDTGYTKCCTQTQLSYCTGPLQVLLCCRASESIVRALNWGLNANYLLILHNNNMYHIVILCQSDDDGLFHTLYCRTIKGAWKCLSYNGTVWQRSWVLKFMSKNVMDCSISTVLL